MASLVIKGLTALFYSVVTVIYNNDTSNMFIVTRQIPVSTSLPQLPKTLTTVTILIDNWKYATCYLRVILNISFVC